MSQAFIHGDVVRQEEVGEIDGGCSGVGVTGLQQIVRRKVRSAANFRIAIFA